jgi:hypothetical protein
LGAVVERFPDTRAGRETIYTMADAALGAFSVFFTQSPSFLDFQRKTTPWMIDERCQGST